MPKIRCSWTKDDPLAIQYHDEEFGVPLERDDDLFERLSLEIFQAGLSWRLILHKREALRRAFANFSIKKVAAFTEKDILRLLNDKGIIRNRLKITATIENAKRVQKIISEYGSFAAYLKQVNGSPEEMNRELKRKFSFMGPKISESFLQSIGKTPPWHEPNCWRYRGES
ncbi:MAG: DNA-3-methyladenine glycosylase I [Candidatus Abyssobacteria bacterium SURF_5]|uniref:DNA-3-methyladenine glycosylase I n=1 Tax=Abyssobacteria bacterium (strain SURF_5) TaxID=2093360 RepID=A0A3A4NGC8_ABYX5|nr:MAG: DNA-3-methyladenine glycosylase I [Candidatus Abyssubacteria bacterium SURF_5]